MSAALRPLSDLRMTDAPEVGGKAASLGELLAQGIRVPDGVVLTVAGAQLSADERRALLERGVGELGDGTFAVRSSGISEDGAERSFAGMYESAWTSRRAASPGRGPYPGQRSAARTHQYAAAGNGIDGGVAVIVQRMVHAGRGRCCADRRSDHRRPRDDPRHRRAGHRRPPRLGRLRRR